MEIRTGGNSAIRITPPDLRLPDNSLYTLRLTGDVPYLIETDPRFTDRRAWLGSDYMQRQFRLDGSNMLKRLGDGFYEQRLIREQIIQLTGSRYLQGFNNDEAQFRALMDAGVAFGHRYHLVPGVALTPEQMALLTSDMVWLVQQEVTLADGSTQQVLAPQVYARVQTGDLNGSGALLAGNNIALDLRQDLTNSGRISGREVTQITAESLTSSGFIGGQNVSLTARTDISNLGGTLTGSDSLRLTAGRDINSVTTTQGDAANRWIDRPAGIFVQNDGGELSLQALNNITLTGSQVSNAGAGSRTRIAAGNDLTLDTVSTARTEYGNWGKGNSRLLEQTAEIGSQINGGGDVVLQAGHDLNARAASVTAKEDLIVAAGNDISISAGKTVENEQSYMYKTSVARSAVTQQESSLSAGSDLTLIAGRDATVSAATIVAEGSVGIRASRDVNLLAEADTEHASSREKKRKEISESVRQQGTEITSGGNTTIFAGRDIAMQAAEAVTQGDIALSAGRDVNLTTATESDYHYLEKTKKKKGFLSKKTWVQYNLVIPLAF
jgi:filamentous hemagglutinin